MIDPHFDLRISAFTPDTIPLNRLAGYMLQFAAVLGNEAHVHFAGLRKGSTVLRALVEPEDIPKVSQRLHSVNTGEAPADLQRAVAVMNNYLREDNARASLRQKGGAQIIKFPGCDAPVAKRIGPIREGGQLDGEVVRIGGKDRTIHALLVGADGAEYKLTTTSRDLARELARHLFCPVRVTGTGTWYRDGDGTWELDSFQLQSFEAVGERTLIEAVAGLRDLEGDGWREMKDPLAEWRDLRSN